MTLLPTVPRLLRTLVLIGVVPMTTSAADPRSISELLWRIAGGPLDPSIFFELESQPTEPRVFTALAEAFEKRESKEERQRISVTLIHLGDGSERYLDLLTGHARQAIEDRTPLFFVYDLSGDITRGEMSLEFQQWCRENKRDPKEVAAMQVFAYPEDVRFLASAQDARAAPLLKRGLDSPNPLIVYYSAEGLALLRDSAALPLIVQSCERFPTGTARFVAKALALYFTPDADSAMERLVKDPDLRAGYKREALRKLTVEFDRKVARQKGKDRE